MARPNFNSNGRFGEETPKIKINKESLKEGFWVFKYIKPYKGKFIAGLIFIGLSSFTTMAFPFLLKQLIDSAQEMSKGNVTLSPGIIAFIMIGILAIQMVFSFLRIYLFTSVGENALADLRKDIYKRMIIMPMEFFAQRRVGELYSRISADVSQIQDTVTTLLAEILRGALTLLISLGLLFFLSLKLTLMTLSVVPLIVIVAVVFGRKIRGMARQAQDQLAESGTIVQETLQGVSNVKAFTNEWFEIARYSRSIAEVVKLSIKNSQYRGLFVSFLLFSTFSSIVFVVWYSTNLMLQGLLSFGSLTAFVVYTGFVGGTMAGFADLFAQLQKTLGATQRVREILKEIPEEVSIADEPLQERYKLKGRVEFNHVAFSYPSRKEIEVLRDINFSAEKGQQIAIVGPSGAGKSTITSIILQFYLPDSGSLLFDGKDASSIPISQLRKQMAFVPQDVMLFGGSILENIAYGKPLASQEEVEEAARKANAHNFIVGFPEGYNTIVGERGIKLSGGQRQRIAIARAILKDPAILILDEATSSLDSESEYLVQEALDKLMKGRTSIVIAHRLSTIRNSDKIIVLEKGIVRESGTHQELLLVENGMYKNLNRLQFELR